MIQPECETAFLNGVPMHELFRHEGKCLFCIALESAYKRGVTSALDGHEGF